MAPKMQRQRSRSCSGSRGSIIRADRQAERQTEWQTGKEKPSRCHGHGPCGWDWAGWDWGWGCVRQCTSHWGLAQRLNNARKAGRQTGRQAATTTFCAFVVSLPLALMKLPLPESSKQKRGRTNTTAEEEVRKLNLLEKSNEINEEFSHDYSVLLVLQFCLRYAWWIGCIDKYLFIIFIYLITYFLFLY